LGLGVHQLSPIKGVVIKARGLVKKWSNFRSMLEVAKDNRVLTEANIVGVVFN